MSRPWPRVYLPDGGDEFRVLAFQNPVSYASLQLSIEGQIIDVQPDAHLVRLL
jgi:hypothetical protein